MLHLEYADEDIKKMKNNITSYSKGLQKELKDLVFKYPKNRNKRYIVCYKEFCDEFNSCILNTTNYSVTSCENAFAIRYYN